MKLYGSPGSPYLRRVRIVAAELGLETSLVDTSAPAGQLALRKVTPIWKFPVAEIDGDIVFDSHVIVDRLFSTHGTGSLCAPSPARRWHDCNILSVIDAGLDSAINVRYQRVEGANVAASEYLSKQKARVESALTWLANELHGSFFAADASAIGMNEIALLTTLDWLIFREEFPVRDNAAFARFLDAHVQRPSFAATRPSLTF